MSQDNRVILLSDLKVGDLLKVCTENSVYRCKVTGSNGEATITYKGNSRSWSCNGLILGSRNSSDRGEVHCSLRPGNRMHFLSLSKGRSTETITSMISRIVVNGGPLILARFGFSPRLVKGQ
jgi:hypothetical protein